MQRNIPATSLREWQLSELKIDFHQFAKSHERARARSPKEIITIKTRITSIDNRNIKLNYKLIGILLHLNWFSRIKIHIFLSHLLHFCA